MFILPYFYIHNLYYIKTMAEKKFTNELKQTFDYIKNTILKEYDCDKISTEYFIISILENEYSVGNKVLSKIMLHDSMENAKVHFYQWLSQNAKSFGGKKEYDDIFELVSYEYTDQYDLFMSSLKHFNIERIGYPLTVMGDDFVFGFGSSDKTKIKRKIFEAYRNKKTNYVDTIK